MAISDQLRKAIEAQEATYYQIAKDADVPWATLVRFVNGERPNIRMDSIDKICESLGLELRPIKRKKK